MLLAHAGAVVVWQVGEPRLATHRIPVDKDLILGRELLGESDDRVSRQHARVRIDGDHLEVIDLGSRNGTYVEGHTLRGGCYPDLPAIVRIGRTVVVLVPDIRVFENRAVEKRGSLVVGASLANVLASIDAAARAENHIALIGSLGVGRELAVAYANMLGGSYEVFDGQGRKLAEVVENRADPRGLLRTIVIVFNRLLEPAELETFAGYVETDIRFVFVAESYAAVESLPAELRTRLVHDTVRFPMFRFDALPVIVRDIVAEHAPGATAHATVIELVLLRSRRVPEADLIMRLRDSTIEWKLNQQPDKTVLRGDDLINGLEEPINGAYCVVGDIYTKRPRRPWRQSRPPEE